MTRHALLALCFLAACKRTDVDASRDTPAPPPASSEASVAVAATREAGEAGEAASNAGEREFESLFDYGRVDPVDAGPSDPLRLTKKPGYDDYANARFGFAVDVPRSFVAMREPENGDGRSWRLGDLAAMTASGMNWILDDELPDCKKTPHVTRIKKAKTSCWRTGKLDDFIYWERWELRHGVLFELRFQYRASLKEAMDAVVTHVSESWLKPR